MVDREKVIKGLRYCRERYCTCGGCPYDDEFHRSIEECLWYRISDAISLLEEQEPKIGHWNFESKYYDAWSNTCSECGKRMTTAVGMYASFCWNCGAKMTGGDLSSSEIPNS